LGEKYSLASQNGYSYTVITSVLLVPMVMMVIYNI